MNRLQLKKLSARRRAKRVISKVQGTAQRPRLAINISNIHINAQLIDDEAGRTIAFASSVGKKIPGTMTDKAVEIGKDIAAKAAKAKISKVVFDRSDKKYHGRLKALAETARSKGLEF